MIYKSRKLLICFFFLPVLVICQTKNFSSFTISGESAFYNNDKLWIFYPVQPIPVYNTLTLASESAAVKNGHFKFHGSVEYPSPLMLSYFSEKLRRGYSSNLIFIEQGEQKVSVGNLEKSKSLGTGLTSKSNKEYAGLLRLFSQKQASTRKDTIAILGGYISQYPSSYVALWLLTLDFIQHGNLPEFAPVMEKFDDEVKTTKTYKSLVRNITIENSLLVGKPFPFSALSFGNNLSDTASHREYTLIDFWASYCSPCIAQFSELNSIYDAFQSRGFTVLGICMDLATDKRMQPTIKQHALKWWNVHDVNGIQAGNLNVSAIPRNFLLDHGGTIVAKDLSPQKLRLFLQEKL